MIVLMNDLTRLLMLSVLTIVTSSALAQDLKLRCNINIKYSYHNGQYETSRSIAIIEISESTDSKSIFISSPDDFANDISVFSKSFQRYDVQSDGLDSSTPNKWDVSTTYTQKNKKSISRIMIDRNTGELIVQRLFDNNSLVTKTTITGMCEKVNTDKKKF